MFAGEFDCERGHRSDSLWFVNLAGKIVGRAYLSTLNRLPLELRAHVRENLKAVGRLDHNRELIEMDVGNAIELFRLGSCAKEPETVSWIEQNLKAGEVFYDVGANVGAYSLIAGKLAGSAGVVYAFEPAAATFAKLVRNVQLNRLVKTVVPFNIALSDQPDVLNLQLSNPVSGAAMHTLGNNGQTAPSSVSQSVLAYPMDRMIQELGLRHPNHLKVDVDGAELAVLKGATSTLREPGLRSVLIEVEEDEPITEEIVGEIEAAGFSIDSKHLHERSGVSNFIFKR